MFLYFAQALLQMTSRGSIRCRHGISGNGCTDRPCLLLLLCLGAGRQGGPWKAMANADGVNWLYSTLWGEIGGGQTNTYQRAGYIVPMFLSRLDSGCPQ